MSKGNGQHGAQTRARVVRPSILHRLMSSYGAIWFTYILLKYDELMAKRDKDELGDREAADLAELRGYIRDAIAARAKGGRA